MALPLEYLFCMETKNFKDSARPTPSRKASRWQSSVDLRGKKRSQAASQPLTLVGTHENHRTLRYESDGHGGWIHLETQKPISVSPRLSLAAGNAALQIAHIEEQFAEPMANESAKPKAVPAKAAPRLDRFYVDGLSAFLILSFFVVAFGILGVIVRGRLTDETRIIIAGEKGDMKFSFGAPIDKKGFLAKVSAQQRRQIAGQTHFVAELISAHSSSAVKEDAKSLAFTIVSESLSAGVDPLLVAAIVKSESTFNRNAESPVGALGLMQILPQTGKYVSDIQDVRWHGPSRLKDPNYNLRLGIAYLQYLHKKFDGNIERILVAYNWGPNNLITALRNGSPVPQMCKKYMTTILSNFKNWSTEYAANSSQYQFLDIEYLS